MLDKEKFAKLIGDNIRRIRLERGFDQEGFARSIDIDRAYYGHIERGTTNVSAYFLYRIALGLKVDVAELFYKIK